METIANSFESDNISWYQCADGKIITPMDVLQMMFFPHHYDRPGDNVCYEPKPYQIPFLKQYLPAEDSFGGVFLPDDFTDSVVGLALACFVISLGIVIAKLTWEKLDPNFNNITPSHKKWYVVANISKSVFLLCIALSPRFWKECYRGFIMDNWPPSLLFIKRCCILYVATDLVALIMVPKLPFSTKMHHTVTTLIVLAVGGGNLRVRGTTGFLGACKMAVLYGSFSSVPYLVNAYLGLRVIYSKRRWLYEMCRLSLVVYMLVCALNWFTHLMWLFGYWGDSNFSLPIILYVMMMVMMINDDIVLIKWLFKQGSPMASKNK